MVAQPPTFPPHDLLEVHLARVRERLAAAAARAGRSESARIVAAIKYLDAQQTLALAQAGVQHLGENRLDALQEKRSFVGDVPGVEWHYIGRLQSRKAEEVAQLAGWVHTLCSDSAAARLGRARDAGHAPRILVQVNTAGDPAKDGIQPDDLLAFLDGLPEGLAVHGLMTMPAFAERPEESRAAFAQLRELLETGREHFDGRHPLTELSMGTSQDAEVAVEEGATFVRLGKILYAPQDLSTEGG
jgi:pyridoxal phosphate enzyme (YggS family)